MFQEGEHKVSFVPLTGFLLLFKQVVSMFCCFGLWIPRSLMIVEMAITS